MSEGKKHEYYLTEKTEIRKGERVATFEEITKDQKVRVTANKIGKRLDPLKVEILE